MNTLKEKILKLKEEKKRRILEAAFREFSRVPFREASINRIIKDAEISRGSFYTYFEDKTDLLQILLRDGSKSLTERSEILGGGVGKDHGESLLPGLQSGCGDGVLEIAADDSSELAEKRRGVLLRIALLEII